MESDISQKQEHGIIVEENSQLLLKRKTMFVPLQVWDEVAQFSNVQEV